MEHIHNEEHKRRGGGRHRGDHSHGAKTFRRGRALAFLENLNSKRELLTKQLEQPEFSDIKQVIQGELKAIDLIIVEYTNHFEIHEQEMQE